MSLQWVRLDTNIFTHDKTLWLTAQKDGWRAYSVYTFSLAYSGGHGTDGFIAKHVLPFIQGTPRVVQLLVDAGMWQYAEGGWQIKNWDQRQELAVITETKRTGKRIAGLKSQCVQRHGLDCGCWKGATV